MSDVKQIAPRTWLYGPDRITDKVVDLVDRTLPHPLPIGKSETQEEKVEA